MLRNFLKEYYFQLLLLLICFLAFGLFTPFLGFYWDDFPYMWFKHISGISGVIKAIALDRPVLGIFYAIPMSVLGESPFQWQIFAIVCRWIFILSAYGLLTGSFLIIYCRINTWFFYFLCFLDFISNGFQLFIPTLF